MIPPLPSYKESVHYLTHFYFFFCIPYLDIILNGEVLAEIPEVLHQPLVLFPPTTTNNNQLCLNHKNN